MYDGTLWASTVWEAAVATGRRALERKDYMASSKRQQTMAKRSREQAVKEKRAQKAEKREATKIAKAEGTIPEHLANRPDGEHPLDKPAE
jgi:hypothetical protein